MKILRQQTVVLIAALAFLIFSAGNASAQNPCHKFKRLTAPSTVRGFIGGESHDCYEIRARKGQTMTIDISWRREEDNRAEFSVSRSASFGGSPVSFGRRSNNDRRWTGKIPATRKYYIYVVAHPTARYTLKTRLK
jgi:hypothetical protein